MIADRLNRINAQNEETRIKHAEEVEQHNKACSESLEAHQAWQGSIWQLKANHSAECKKLRQAHDASCAELKAVWTSHKQLVDKDNDMAEATAKRRHAEMVASVKSSNAEKREHHAKAQTVRPPFLYVSPAKKLNRNSAVMRTLSLWNSWLCNALSDREMPHS